MIPRKDLASRGYWLLSLIMMLCIQLGSVQNVVINYPHFAVYGHNHFQSWNVTSGDDETFVYPDHVNFSVFAEYKFFINPINFDTNTPGNFFIGAKDVLYEMNANLSVVRHYQWPVSSSSASSCASISIDTSFACHNHIRLYTRLPQDNATDRLWVCGTDAYNPVCKTLDINNIADQSGQSNTNVSTNNVGMISVHPALPALWGFQDKTQLLASGFYTPNMWNNYDFARYNVSYNTGTKHLDINFNTPDRTIQSSDDYHIREPYHPISMYDVRLSPENDTSGMYLFFFREREFTAQDSSAAPVRSRVIRVCKNDIARTSPSRFFGSLLKAEIFCAKRPLGTPEAFGAQTFYYTGLRDTHYGYNNSRWYGNRFVWDRLMYGAFTSEQYAPNGTAICVYYGGVKNFEDVSHFLDGNHRGVLEVFNQNHFVPKNGMRVANSFLNCDAANARTDPDLLLAESGIQQYKGLYLPLLELPGEVVTKIAVDEVCVVMFNNTNKCMMQDVVFVGTNVGKIYKIVFTTKISEYPNINRLGLDGVSHDPVIAQEWQLADSNSVEQLYLRKDGNKRYLYATTYSRVYKFAAYNCERHANCRDCVASRDPYCYWTANNKCEFLSDLVDIENSGEIDVTGHLQSIHTGVSSSCNEASYCDVQVTPNYPSGFLVKHTCQGTSSIRLLVDSHGCPSATLSFPINAMTQVINDTNILGLRLYRVTFTANYTSNPTFSNVSFVTTVGGVPTVPTSNEVYATGKSNGRVQVVVNIDGCSLHSTPNDHTIFVSFRGVNDSYINSSQPYNGGNTFIAGPYYSCENVTYAVSITNSYGTSPVYTGIIQPYTTPPGRPTNVNVNSVTSDTATLSWGPPDLGVDNNYCNVITGYSIYVNSVKKRDCITGTSFIIHGLTPNTNYTFGVSACSDGGESNPSNIASTTLCEGPSRLLGLDSNVLSSVSLSFTWNEPLTFNGTNLRYTLEEDCFNETTQTYDTNFYTITQTTHTITSLQPLSSCCLTVTPATTCDSVTYTGLPRIACNKTWDASPGPIENLNIVSNGPTSIFLTWLPPMNYSGIGLMYEITVTDPMGITLSFETSQFFRHVTEDLYNDTEYKCCMISRNDIGSSSPVCMNVTTLPSPPEPPIDVSLQFTGCILTVSWLDPTSERYSVDTYNVSVQCNKDIRSMAVTAPTLSAEFDYCTNPNRPTLTWCAAQVFSENDVGPSALSEWVNIVTPNIISQPECYETQNIGNFVTISYTLTSAYALDTLRVNYSLLDLEDNNIVDYGDIPFEGQNTITFNVTRLKPYNFTLRICDGNERICSPFCNRNFNASSMSPSPPENVTAILIIYDSIYLVWSPPRNESGNFTYTVQVTGPISGPKSRTTNNTYILWDGLEPESQYSVSVFATDIASGISSPFSDRIIVETDAGMAIPASVGAIYYVNNNENRLNIYWEGPTNYNGTVRYFTIVWSSDLMTSSPGNVITCDSLLSTSSHLIQVNTSSMRSIDINNPEGLNANTNSFLLCIAARTTAGRGNWASTIITQDSIMTGGLTGGGDSSDSQALILVTVVAVLAILAAFAIVIVFGLVCFMRHRNKSNSGTPTSNGSSKLKGNIRKAIRTPDRDNTQSIRSTAPMVTDQC